MSNDSHSETTQSPGPELLQIPKHRRQERSCDSCRQRKSRCDGPSMADRRCSNCSAFGTPCTYVLPSRTRGPKNGMVEELKKVNESLKKENDSLRRENTSLRAKLLRSQTIFSQCSQRSGKTTDDDPHEIASVFHCTTPQSVASAIASAVGTPLEVEDPLADEVDLTGEDLAGHFSEFSLKTRHFHSGGILALAKNAMAMKAKYFGPPLVPHPRRRWYWDALPWEKDAHEQEQHYHYPDEDLIASLLELYFSNVHPTVPILHRTSFEQSVAEGRHLLDAEFGGLLLSVLALASRCSDDPRVFVNNDPTVSLSAGFKFATQVKAIRFAFELSIHEVQMFLLLSLFAIGTSFPQAAHVYLGIGIHYLQHHRHYRRKREGRELNSEEELWKRIFWSYVNCERMACVFQGRPSVLPIEDFDLALEVDDEYWDRGLVQPLGKPSLLSSFVSDSRLSEILGDVMHRLYSSRKAKIDLGWSGPEWDQRVVAELDSAMNDFSSSVPPHLRWNLDDPPQGVFFDQSALLHISYHLLQIMIHRPFINRPSAPAAPSLSICTRAARTILHTADIWLKTKKHLHLPNVLNGVFISGVVLVLKMFGAKRTGLSADTNDDLPHIETALRILKFAEPRWQLAGRLWEVLEDLSSFDSESPRNSDGESSSFDTRQSKILPSPHPAPHALPPQHQQHHLAGGSRETTYGLVPGMSIEQLLTNTNPLDSMNDILDGDFMSMWIDAPIPGDFAQWDNNFGV
ncbi:fungal-specific transcription factor domain-containing protein [Mycena metata]|uniref:Fungal-specific transcription factor domain-containing protein n=1 Tax=Mycena metata TaxID=1033252 RepID=A0AAD7HPJ3_9AGAR|nr:fungal-specific transcription factor domain-containing protein [Mycena metata]